MEVRAWSVRQLTAACREETARYLRREPSTEVSCLELFRRAIRDRDQEAWEALLHQYRGIVLSWIHRHPTAAALREEDDYWVNRAFERFWTALGAERLDLFDSLAALLRYLKLCAHSSLLDEVRQRARAQFEPLSDNLPATLPGYSPEGTVIGSLASEDLWRVVERETQDERELIVARLSFVLGLKPSEIFEHHSQTFTDVSEVYRVKRNLIDRLRRNATLQKFEGR